MICGSFTKSGKIQIFAGGNLQHRYHSGPGFSEMNNDDFHSDVTTDDRLSNMANLFDLKKGPPV